jgi:hypothetical protein
MSPSYFQVYKTTPSSKIVQKDNLLVYEDDNCRVSYNFWDEGGNIGFDFFNKTENNIYLNLEESFFILNGVSYNYFRNRVYTYSKNSGINAYQNIAVSKTKIGSDYLDFIQTNRANPSSNIGIVNSRGFSVSYNEEKIIIIPAKTSKNITEYNINETLFRDCDLLKYPTKKEIKTKSFTKSESPFVFSNRITYSIGQSGNQIKFENEFYVSEITNYPESLILESKNDEYCGQKSVVLVKYFNNVSPDKFYIQYNKGLDTWKH